MNARKVAMDQKVGEILKPRIQKLIGAGWKDPDYLARQLTDDFAREGLFKSFGEEEAGRAHAWMQSFIEVYAFELLAATS